MKKSFARRTFLWSHRWFGLIAGLYFVLFGLTGSYLVYEDGLESFLYSSRFQASQSSPAFQLPDLIRAAQVELKSSRHPSRVTLPASDKAKAILVFNRAEPGEPAKNVTVTVDPTDYSVQGPFERFDSVGGYMFAFHHDLFLGAATARVWMGISALFLLAILLSGLWLWWPGVKYFRRSLAWPSFRSLYKAALDLHKLFGVYSLILMLAVTFSGLYISVPSWFQMGDKAGGGVPRGPGPAVAVPEMDYGALQNDLAAKGLLKRPLSVSYNSREHIYVVRTSESAPVFIYNPSAHTLEPRVEEVKEFDMRRLQRQIHGGDYWGQVGEVLTFISGLLPLFFYVSGVYVWFRKRGLA